MIDETQSSEIIVDGNILIFNTFQASNACAQV
jgi:hypothetical protein